jgi:hypothetical protein
MYFAAEFYQSVVLTGSRKPRGEMNGNQQSGIEVECVNGAGKAGTGDQHAWTGRIVVAGRKREKRRRRLSQVLQPHHCGYLVLIEKRVVRRNKHLSLNPISLPAQDPLE